MSTLTSDHSRIEERSLALHRLVAEKIAAEPALVARARDNISRWQAARSEKSAALAEWDQILTHPLEEIAAVLVERSERANRLRQSSPFAGTLSETERRAVYELFATRAHHTGRQHDQR